MLNKAKYALEQNKIGEEKEQIALAMSSANTENIDDFRARKVTFIIL